jgi:vancomycin permeability regulator SanA
VASDLQPYGRSGLAATVREAAARVKAVGSVALRMPVTLGPPVPIDGDGRDSWGPPKP